MSTPKLLTTKAQRLRYLTVKKLMTDSPWELAKAIGLSYTGDMCPVPHGGMWYYAKTWRTNEEAPYVRCYPGDGAFAVEHGIIYRPTQEQVLSAFKCCDVDPATAEPTLTYMEIESLVAYRGTEQDDMQWFEKDEQRHNDFNEFQICRVIRYYLNQIIPED